MAHHLTNLTSPLTSLPEAGSQSSVWCLGARRPKQTSNNLVRQPIRGHQRDRGRDRGRDRRLRGDSSPENGGTNLPDEGAFHAVDERGLKVADQL
jgi:hypothetical protein